MGKNYQLICDEQIKELTNGGKIPSLLLHSCCGPCSSYVLEYLSRFFCVTVAFFNPNIYPEKEYTKRLEAQREIIDKMPVCNRVQLLEMPYNHQSFLTSVKGLESEKEGGKRCIECFGLRLFETAKTAKKHGFDCFTTTLSVSPHKNAEFLNKIGEEAENIFGVKYLASDFKKREGYKRSIELSREYNLYRQRYCGCEFSMERD